ncbi:MAG: MtrAB system histidine kinase MtrB [Candidatus Nanopelagicales bacterium]
MTWSIHNLFSALRKSWRSSLTLRVFVTTVVMSIIAATVVFVVLLTQIRDGLITQRSDDSLVQANRGIDIARNIATNSNPTLSVAEENALVDAIIAGVVNAAGTARDFEVLLLSSELSATTIERGTNQISETSLSDAIRSATSKDRQLVRQLTTLEYLDGTAVPGIVVGVPITLPSLGRYELYQLFPLSNEIETLTLLTSASAFAGGFLVLAFVLLALVLTTQVVRPVRLAAESAQRLSEGNLAERLNVTGEDDLARLALAFNSMAASLEQQIEQLKELSKVQQQFVSDVSHELRTPLTTITMAADLLNSSSEDFDPASKRASVLLFQQTQRFELLLMELLEISRHDAKAATLEVSCINLNELISGTIEDLSPISEELGIDVRLESNDEVNAFWCDSRRLERIIRNLVSNAIEHTNSHGVDVKITVSHDFVDVAVIDYGSGLSKEHQARVFDRFWRADPSRQRTLGGTGLGLAIALEDAKLHGGTIRVLSESGAGSTFTLTVPRNLNSRSDLGNQEAAS